jgi:hypothetical protein
MFCKKCLTNLALVLDFSWFRMCSKAFTWDGGLACVLMVLKTLGIDRCDSIADLERLCRTTRLSL